MGVVSDSCLREPYSQNDGKNHMVSRLNPVTIRISFPGKTYRLGDTVNVRVHITTTDTNVTVREARIGIECQVRYTEIRSGISRMDSRRRAGVFLGRPPQTTTTPIEVELSDTHDGPAFLTNRLLQARRTNSSDVRLQIPSELGRNAIYAQDTARPAFSWWVVVTADVSLARDVTESRPIDISLGSRVTG